MSILDKVHKTIYHDLMKQQEELNSNRLLQYNYTAIIYISNYKNINFFGTKFKFEFPAFRQYASNWVYQFGYANTKEQLQTALPALLEMLIKPRIDKGLELPNDIIESMYRIEEGTTNETFRVVTLWGFLRPTETDDNVRFYKYPLGAPEVWKEPRRW